MIAQHRKKECCTSEEGKLKNKIMFAEIFFFYHFASLQNSVFRVSKLFFTHSHTSFQITIYKVSNLENKLIQWENTDKFENLKNSLRNIVKKMLQFWRRKSQKQHNVCRDIFIFLHFASLQILFFDLAKLFFVRFWAFEHLVSTFQNFIFSFESWQDNNPIYLNGYGGIGAG